ncbi:MULTISPECIES: TIGR02611 family protein [unclassified Streptomyces]|uniref:TIGR02611 family protein n=1 Tax=unclassified Streptomyces TaxID=2593676 RepID=UPI000805801C|nr:MULTISPECIES: TIGR02611 family protein [unclassified Streptomyces]MYR76583.1 TIGR02611 family protein [Streptomyces sp. SID4925]SBU93758.1 TIGR02611 family protein [Streptomyces sp. OspMP-M45]
MNAESDEEGRATASVASGSSAADGRTADRALGSRAPAYIRSSRVLHLSWQAGIFVVGLAVVAAGIVMLPLPGPGWLVIFGGMAIWATEFVWAQLVLRWTKRKVTAAAQRALDPKVRRRNVILTTVGLVIIAVLVGIYVWNFGIVMPWKIDR